MSAKCSHPGRRLGLRSMETPIQSNVFPLRALGSFQVIHSLVALQLHLRMRGGIIEIFVLKTCEPEGSGAEMVPPPLCFSSGKYFECRIRTCHVVRWCVSGVCAATP